VKEASIVVFSDHGVTALRSVLHGIWDSVAEPGELFVVAAHPDETVAGYLGRQYLRGRISGFELVRCEASSGHCALNRAVHAVSGTYLARVPDDVTFAQSWLDKAVGVLDESPEIGMLSLSQAPEAPRRGRPPKPRAEVTVRDCIDTTCFVTRRELFEDHEQLARGPRAAALPKQQGPGPQAPAQPKQRAQGPQAAPSETVCPYQVRLMKRGFKLGYLPGQVQRVQMLDAVHVANGVALEADLPFHEGGTGALQKLRQTYQLGDDVLVTCMACGNNELEVLAARIDFCSRHNIAVGFTYELRCQECHEVHYEADTQFRCPK
jgi:hypothetical protein